ncbi:hypothetical protein [Microbacterium enclense]|uniref:hypothetical protein n=1 Tax=Microbacterium enclense TaxID=993073 RepID=UPI003F812BBC
MRTCHAFGGAAVVAAAEPLSSKLGAAFATPDVGDIIGADHPGWSPRLVAGDDAAGGGDIATALDPGTGGDGPVLRAPVGHERLSLGETQSATEPAASTTAAARLTSEVAPYIEPGDTTALVVPNLV